MKNCASFSIKTLFLVSFLLIFPSTHWGQDLILFNNVIGKVKKCTIKSYSVKESLDEFDAEDLLSKEIFEYYLNGGLKAKTVFRNFQIAKWNYTTDSKLISIYWEYSDGNNPTGIDSLIYNASGNLIKKIIYEKTGDKWTRNYIYDYKYDDKDNLYLITCVYDNLGDVQPYNTYPNFFFPKYDGFSIKESESFLRHLDEENSEIWDRSEREGESLHGQKITIDNLDYFKEVSIKFEYDTNRNWTKATLFTGKKPFRIYLRVITYYE